MAEGFAGSAPPMNSSTHPADTSRSNIWRINTLVRLDPLPGEDPEKSNLARPSLDISTGYRYSLPGSHAADCRRCIERTSIDAPHRARCDRGIPGSTVFPAGHLAD